MLDSVTVGRVGLLMSFPCSEDNGYSSNIVRENTIAMTVMSGKGRGLKQKVQDQIELANDGNMTAVKSSKLNV